MVSRSVPPVTGSLLVTVMIAFPQYAWDEWLDLHGQQVHIIRHEPEHATGYITVTLDITIQSPAPASFAQRI